MSIINTTPSNSQKIYSSIKRRDMKPKSSKCLPKSAIYGIAGKTPFQVQRRNERERRRVQAVNHGYEVLAQQLADWDELKDKKLTKAQTLKAAIMYIEHMEKLLRSTSASPSYNLNKNVESSSSLTCIDDEENKYCCSLPSVSNQQSHDFLSNSNSPSNDEYFSPIGAISTNSASDSELYNNNLESYCIKPNAELKLESPSFNNRINHGNFNFPNNKINLYQQHNTQIHHLTATNNLLPKANYPLNYPLTLQSSHSINNIDYMYQESNIYQNQQSQISPLYYCTNSNQYAYNIIRNYHSV